jgi:RNA polymerase sigma factor (sigma-70 family)
MKTDVPKSAESRVEKCAGLLRDDYARQSSHLTFDDAVRVMSRCGLSPEEWMAVWETLAANGVRVHDLELADARDIREQIGEENKPRPLPAREERDRHAFVGQDQHQKLLTHEQEILLGRRVQTGKNLGDLSFDAQNLNGRAILDAAAQAKVTLTLSNLRLVVHCAKRYARLSPVSLDDLIQDGMVGLLKAVDRFDPERGFRFSTYATYWINQSLGRAIDQSGRTIRLPSHISDRIVRVRRKRRLLALELRRAPTSNELARDLGMELAELNFLLSVDVEIRPLDRSGEGSVGAQPRVAVRSRFESPELAAERDELTIIIKAVLESLGPRSARILVLRFGLFGNKPRTLSQVGDKLGITRERVRQLEKKALDKIANTYRGHKLRPFLNGGSDSDV